MVSGGGRLQKAKLGEGGSDDCWRTTPPNVVSENENFFVGGSIDEDVMTTEEFEHSPLPNDCFCGIKSPFDVELVFNGDIDKEDPEIP